MSISVFDIFTIGIGPSSSHTVGPMKAAKRFMDEVINQKLYLNPIILKCDLYGSLALTGKGHGTDKAILLGFELHEPETIDSNEIQNYIQRIEKDKNLQFNFKNQDITISFHPKKDLKFHRRVNLPFHPNGMAFACFDKDNKELLRMVFYSVGGGFIVTEEEAKADASIEQHHSKLPYAFQSAKELLDLCEKHSKTIPEIMLENEKTWRSEKEIKDGLIQFWEVMQDCVRRGFKNEGTLPGGLNVKRRAPSLFRELSQNPEKNLTDALSILDWVNLYALAVNEENAAGGQVVTAPTNGAAGILPAILHYYVKFCPKSSDEGIIDFLLTAAAIAILYKKNASISGAEVGCQGEVGVACSMAAAALTQVLGGTPLQVENAAEIAMEHNLGLTCDPIGGLVQIPCIERNAMGAIKSINAARMSMRGDGSHFVSLDKVIATMKQTGKDMKKQYKETSRGGLAVNIPEC
jgi:L-serine dehydratase